MGGDHGHGSHGHGHDHHHGPPKVPDWKSYRVEDAPELVQLRTVLAQKGLKDPWLRNEVWRYHRSEWGTRAERWKLTVFRGFKWGFAAFVGVIAIEKALDVINPSSHDHHGHGHGSSSH